MLHLLLQDRYLMYIQISRPVGPQESSNATMATKNKFNPPESTIFNQEEYENTRQDTDKPFNSSIFDMQTSNSDDNGNWSFNTSNVNTSRDDDSVSIDIELEKTTEQTFWN